MEKWLARDVHAPTKSTEWWLAQSLKVTGGRCLKCRGYTDGVYVPPSLENNLECAVVEHCRLCGWEHTLITGRVGEPTREHARPSSAQKPLGVPGMGETRNKYGGVSPSTYYRRLRQGKVPSEQKTHYHDVHDKGSARDE